MPVISIPDSQFDWKIAFGDEVSFKFTMDIQHFEVDNPKYFNPAVPSGGFRSGNVIGPYVANKKKNVNVKFKYDNSDLVATTHTILIGD
jgi:hypothetical protein